MRATTLIAATTATLLPLAAGCASPVEPRVEALEARLAAIEGSEDPAVGSRRKQLLALEAEAEALRKTLLSLNEQVEQLDADLTARTDAAVAKVDEATRSLANTQNDAKSLVAKVAQIEDIQKLSFAVPKLLEQREEVDKLVTELRAAHERVVKAGGQVLRARRVEVVDAEGDPVVVIEAVEREGRSVGRITTTNGAGNPLVAISATDEGRGMVETSDGRGHRLMMLTSVKDGRSGALLLYDVKGTRLVSLASKDRRGGSVIVRNDAGDSIGTIEADDTGEGVIGAWNKEGKGRMLTAPNR